MTDALYVIAKAPRSGFAKTRLGRSIGDPRAIELYCAFLQDISDRLRTGSWPLGWYITPADAWPQMQPLVGPITASEHVLFQPEGDLTERQRWLFQSAAERGEQRLVLIASDSPQIELRTIDQAFAALETHDVVFGPTIDGGYYLIGMRGWHDVLQRVSMSTSTVLQQIVTQARAMGLSVALTEPLFDVDTDDDLLALCEVAQHRGDLCHTRATLIAQGFLEQSVADHLSLSALEGKR